MKKIAILLLVIFCVASLRAQGRKMYIDLNNGQRITFDTGTISKITLTPAVLPKYDAMNIFTRYTIPSPVEYYTTQVDSITFGDTGLGEYIAIYDPSNEIVPGITIKYPIDRPHGVDSITFAPYEVNTNVIQLSGRYWSIIPGDSETGDYFSSVWSGNRIYCSEPGRYYQLNLSLKIENDTTFDQPEGPWLIGEWSLGINAQGNQLLSVSSYYHDISEGWLIMDNLDSDSFVIIDTASHVSSAVFIPGSDSIIYYAYGSYSSTNHFPSDAGYYMIDAKSGHKTFLLPFISEIGPDEVINGFDISPDGKKLLIPSVSSVRLPLAIEYDLYNHQFDTLNVSFPSAEVRALWLRYSHDGSKILYDNYPLGSFSDVPMIDTSEIGIIDLKTNSKTVLKTNPSSEGLWVSVFPQWSPDDGHIVYQCARILSEPPGYVGEFQVCILNTLQ